MSTDFAVSRTVDGNKTSDLLSSLTYFTAGVTIRILMATRRNIISISLNSTGYYDEELPLENLTSATTVDYDPVENKVYWADSMVSEHKHL